MGRHHTHVAPGAGAVKYVSFITLLKSINFDFFNSAYMAIAGIISSQIDKTVWSKVIPLKVEAFTWRMMEESIYTLKS